MLVILAFAAGALLHHGIEQPLRRLRTSPPVTAAAWLAASAVLSLLAIAVFHRW